MNDWFSSNKDREAQFAGQFYPGDKTGLENQLQRLFMDAEKENKKQGFPASNKRLRALITPHAGYVFSGKVAATAFQLIPEKENYKRIFVLASSHRFSFPGVSVFDRGNYKTPLGEVNVDTKLSKQLTENSDLFIDHTDAHQNEHSLEVQLPFLQYKLGSNFLLVPLILGTHDPEICKKIAETLKPWFTNDNLFVISTDFSHYPEYNDAIKIDFLTAQAVCSNKPEKLLSALNENKKLKINNLATSLCGWTSVLTLLYLTEKSKLQYQKISYQNSGDSEIYSDKKRVVGYWGIALVDDKKSFQIAENEKHEILEKARNAIEIFVKKGTKGKIQPPLSNGILNEITGVFVSIYIENELRGCIGGFAQEKTLNELVQKMAVSASRDRRFDSVKPEELDKMKLEISILSPLKKIKSIDEIELGKHGIYIIKGSFKGTFLPQVATKTGWDLEQFLGHCSRDKAGIGWDGWKTAELFTYEAIIFKG